MIPDMPLRDRVLRIHLRIVEENFHRSPNVLRELGESNHIALGRFVANLYQSLELAIPTPADSNVRGRLETKWCGELGI